MVIQLALVIIKCVLVMDTMQVVHQNVIRMELVVAILVIVIHRQVAMVSVKLMDLAKVVTEWYVVATIMHLIIVATSAMDMVHVFVIVVQYVHVIIILIALVII